MLVDKKNMFWECVCSFTMLSCSAFNCDFDADVVVFFLSKSEAFINPEI